MLAAVPNPWVRCGSSSDPEPHCCNVSYHTTTVTVAIGRVVPSTTQYFNSTISDQIKYLSSDCIVTWSVCRFCSLSLCCTSRCQIWGGNNNCQVAIEILRITPVMWRYITAIECILVQSLILHWDVKDRLKLHNLHTIHILIKSDLKYLIGAKVAKTVIWNGCPGSTGSKTLRVYFRPG
jgi:hypothetical protein